MYNDFEEYKDKNGNHIDPFWLFVIISLIAIALMSNI
jgi:hypothetical protein